MMKELFGIIAKPYGPTTKATRRHASPFSACWALRNSSLRIRPWRQFLGPCTQTRGFLF